jgi:DNA-binding NarL/FixJ family response regulator
MRSVFLSCNDTAYYEKLRMTFQVDPNFRICGEQTNSVDAVKDVVRLQPDLVILEMELTPMNDLYVAETIKMVLPKVPLFLVTDHHDHRFERRALSRGVDAIFEKDDDTTTLLLNARAAVGIV